MRVIFITWNGDIVKKTVLFFLSCLMVLLSCSAQASGWPRTFTDSKGTHTLPKAPLRIVSTSVTLTGSLLALDAPVIASGTTRPGNKVSDDHGFLRQWGEIAVQRKVKALPPGESNPELIATLHPDLILVSATGLDSAMAEWDKLSKIAPTIVINYGDQSWQELLTELGQLTGHEKQAAERIAQFNTHLAKVKSAIKLPPQPVNAMVWNAHASLANVWTTVSAQGQLLSQLGFTLSEPGQGQRMVSQRGKRQDIIPLQGENLVVGLSGQTFLLFAANQKDVTSVKNNPLLAHLPAVEANRVYALGGDNFRLDYYSASHLLDTLATLFPAH
nr:Fe2+-enterobactin ABC transporter substrate-binding protein [Mangrovibacter yixingensis]